MFEGVKKPSALRPLRYPWFQTWSWAACMKWLSSWGFLWCWLLFFVGQRVLRVDIIKFSFELSNVFALFLTYSFVPFDDVSDTWSSTFILSLPAALLSSLVTLSMSNCLFSSSAFFNFHSSSERSPSKSSGSSVERLCKTQSFGALKQCKSSHYSLFSWYSQNDKWRNLSNGMRRSSSYSVFPKNFSKVLLSFIFPVWDLYISWVLYVFTHILIDLQVCHNHAVVARWRTTCKDADLPPSLLHKRLAHCQRARKFINRTCLHE